MASGPDRTPIIRAADAGVDRSSGRLGPSGRQPAARDASARTVKAVPSRLDAAVQPSREGSSRG